ncbi:alpha/beta fold hydrolase [Xanthobacter versatilis]|uniref:alpha/beta fold hydrolase n=1 Tax=Xanthobacter autotrophicus (strain ATCC BAA-1158 / Py2) TaxID=78245 RepID=UPI003727339F
MARPALILIPGLLNDADLWRDQIVALADLADCHVADITQGETLRGLAQAVLAKAPARFALAGFSLGGFVAQEMVRIAPERIERLALIDTSIHADVPEREEQRRALNRAALAPGKFHGFGDRLLATYLDPAHIADEAIVERIRGMTERLGPEVFVRQNSMARVDGTHVLRTLACPLLVMCGENDRLTPLADHEEMAALAPDARLVVVPDSGHMTPIENPRVVNEALRAWLAGLAPHGAPGPETSHPADRATQQPEPWPPDPAGQSSTAR